MSQELLTQDLVERAKAGDDEAFTLLWDRGEEHDDRPASEDAIWGEDGKDRKGHGRPRLSGTSCIPLLLAWLRFLRN